MTSKEIIRYLKQTLQLTTEMQPLAHDATQHSIKKYENIAELEKKIIISKVYLQEIIKQLEDRYALRLFIKCVLSFAGYVSLGIFLGLFIAHRT